MLFMRSILVSTILLLITLTSCSIGTTVNSEPVSPFQSNSSKRSVILAGTSNPASIYCSFDSGKSWNESVIQSSKIGSSVNAFAGCDSVMYAAVSTIGILKSTDVGKHWTVLSNGDEAYSLCIFNDWILFGTPDGFRRIRQGRSNVEWAKSGAYSVDPRSFAFLGSKVIAGNGSQSLWRIMVSTDSGATWMPSSDGIDSNDVLQNIVALNGNLFASGGCQTVYMSLDSGVTWRHFITTTPYDYAHSMAVDSLSILVGTERNGLFKFSKSDSILTRIKSFNGGSIPSMTVIDGQIFLATDQGIFCSSDHGKSWEARNQGIKNWNVFTIW